jgi:AbrB family looped-hinge helix DNA binding protein
MKKYPKIVQADSRGQIVIPKDVRNELGIDEGTGFYMFTIEGEGIFLKRIKDHDLTGDASIKELDDKAEKIGLDRKNLKKSAEQYKKRKEGNLELL